MIKTILVVQMTDIREAMDKVQADMDKLFKDSSLYLESRRLVEMAFLDLRHELNPNSFNLEVESLDDAVSMTLDEALSGKLEEHLDIDKETA